MTTSKWVKIKEKSEQEELLKEYFENNLIDHLKAPYLPNGGDNQPDEVLRRGALLDNNDFLTRIFDRFNYPVPSYEQMKSICAEPGGLRQLLAQHLTILTPLILNGERTALNQKVIDAIGPNRYKALVEHASEQQIAGNFVKALLASFLQRLIDNNPEFKEDIYNTMGGEITRLGAQTTIEGLPPAIDKDILKKNVLELKNLLENIEINIKDRINEKLGEALELLDPPPDSDYLVHFTEELRLVKANEAYNYAIERAKIAEQPIADLPQKVALKKVMQEFENLLVQAELYGIKLPQKAYMLQQLEQGLELLDPPPSSIVSNFDDSIRTANARILYDNVISNLTEDVTVFLNKTPKPKDTEVNWLVKLIRKIFKNEELLQSKEEKLSSQQQKEERAMNNRKLFAKLNELNQRLEIEPENDASNIPSSRR